MEIISSSWLIGALKYTSWVFASIIILLSHSSHLQCINSFLAPISYSNPVCLCLSVFPISKCFTWRMDCTPILQITIKRKFQISKTVKPMLCLSFLIKCVFRKILWYIIVLSGFEGGNQILQLILDFKAGSYKPNRLVAMGLTLCSHYAPWTEIESSWWNQITISVGKCYFRSWCEKQKDSYLSDLHSGI